MIIKTDMKNETNITEVQLLLNQEVEVTGISRFRGRRGIVTRVMADGRTLDVLVDGVGDVFLDVTLVREVCERTQFAKTEQSLGPIANSVIQDGI
jgi:hypothetical protein